MGIFEVITPWGYNSLLIGVIAPYFCCRGPNLWTSFQDLSQVVDFFRSPRVRWHYCWWQPNIRKRKTSWGWENISLLYRVWDTSQVVGLGISEPSTEIMILKHGFWKTMPHWSYSLRPRKRFVNFGYGKKQVSKGGRESVLGDSIRDPTGFAIHFLSGGMPSLRHTAPA